MNIAIIGTGNVGGTLATAWSKKGHRIRLGVRNQSQFKGQHLLDNPNTSAHHIEMAVVLSDIVVLATPAKSTIQVTESLGDTSGKVIIDTMNIVGGHGPANFNNTTMAILAHTATTDVVKCFNTTGFNNMQNPMYERRPLDMFVAGDSAHGKTIATQLALEVGFGSCYDVGGNDKFTLMEQFAGFWINLAMMQGHGREIGFTLLKR